MPKQEEEDYEREKYRRQKSKSPRRSEPLLFNDQGIARVGSANAMNVNEGSANGLMTAKNVYAGSASGFVTGNIENEERNRTISREYETVPMSDGENEHGRTGLRESVAEGAYGLSDTQSGGMNDLQRMNAPKEVMTNTSRV